MLQHIEVQFQEGVNSLNISVRMGIGMQQWNTRVHHSSALHQKIWSQRVTVHGTNACYLLLCPSVGSVPNCSCESLIHVSITFPVNRYVLNCLLTTDVGYFHSMLWRVLWLVMVDSGLVFSDNKPQKASNSWWKRSNRLRLTARRFAFLFYCDLLWNPSCRNIMKAQSVMNNFMRTTMTNVHIMGYFVNSHLSITQNHGTQSFSVFISRRRGRASGSFIINDTSATVFKYGEPITHSTLRLSTVPTLCWKSTTDFCPWEFMLSGKEYKFEVNPLIFRYLVTSPLLDYNVPFSTLLSGTLYFLFFLR